MPSWGHFRAPRLRRGILQSGSRFSLSPSGMNKTEPWAPQNLASFPFVWVQECSPTEKSQGYPILCLPCVCRREMLRKARRGHGAGRQPLSLSGTTAGLGVEVAEGSPGAAAGSFLRGRPFAYESILCFYLFSPRSSFQKKHTPKTEQTKTPDLNALSQTRLLLRETHFSTGRTGVSASLLFPQRTKGREASAAVVQACRPPFLTSPLASAERSLNRLSCEEMFSLFFIIY